MESMRFAITFEREVDGRWMAEIEALPGVMAYGDTVDAARKRVKEIALVTLATLSESGHMALQDPISFDDLRA